MKKKSILACLLIVFLCASHAWSDTKLTRSIINGLNAKLNRVEYEVTFPNRDKVEVWRASYSFSKENGVVQIDYKHDITFYPTKQKKYKKDRWREKGFFRLPVTDLDLDRTKKALLTNKQNIVLYCKDDKPCIKIQSTDLGRVGKQKTGTLSRSRAVLHLSDKALAQEVFRDLELIIK